MNANYHRQIMQEALSRKVSQTALATMIAANLKQDNLAGQVGHPEFHFDDNALIASQDYMDQQRRLAISSLSSQQDAETAQQAFGRLAHGSQDYYAHSNYAALWVDLHPECTAAEIDPLDPEILELPGLHSGRIYYPGEVFTYLPLIGRAFKYLLPRDAHAWMNLDSPASGPLFDFAMAAAIKRTRIEFETLSSRLSELGGTALVLLLTGLRETPTSVKPY